MSASSSAGDRLPFADLALDAFGFLSGMGFAVVRRESTLVRFRATRSSSTSITAARHSRLAWSLVALTGRSCIPCMRYSPRLPPMSWAGPAVRWSTRRLSSHVAAVAETIHHDCADLLEGKDAALKALCVTASASREAITPLKRNTGRSSMRPTERGSTRIATERQISTRLRLQPSTRPVAGVWRSYAGRQTSG